MDMGGEEFGADMRLVETFLFVILTVVLPAAVRCVRALLRPAYRRARVRWAEAIARRAVHRDEAAQRAVVLWAARASAMPLREMDERGRLSFEAWAALDRAHRAVVSFAERGCRCFLFACSRVAKLPLLEAERRACIAAEAEAACSKIHDAASALRQLRAAGDPSGLLRRSCFLGSLPAHWVGDPSRVVQVVPETSEVFAALRDSLATRGDWLGHGRDARRPGSYSNLQLSRAWRVESPSLWRQYVLAREQVSDEVQGKQLPRARIKVRQATADTLGPQGQRLPDRLLSDTGINELRLFHGTRPSSLRGILKYGFNERLCSTGLFGDAVYMAEDAGKSDQYCYTDAWDPDLRKVLYAGRRAPPGHLYIFVCRAVCGYPALTKDGKQCVGGHPLYASGRRELAEVGAHGARFTSLLAELGGVVQRYREFVFFRGQLLYPEYLLAYRRC